MKRLNFYIPLVIILIVTALIYTRALQNGILGWDDQQHITNNNDIKSLSLQNLKTIFTSYYVKMYHPLVTLSFAVEYHFFGLTPAVYHATNVLFHLANVVLVFYLVLFLSQRRATAIIAACLFGIHPMHVESVAWITERKDVVYAFFYLSALIFYLRFVQQRTVKNYSMLLVCFVLSLFSKTTAITFPIILVLIDLYSQRKVTAHSLLEKLPAFVLSLVFGLIALHSQGASISANESNFDVIDRLFLASYSLSYYIIHLFAPINLSVVHFFPVKTHGMLPVEYYLAVIPLVLVAFVGTRKGIFQREYVFGLLFFIVMLSVNINIVPFSMAVVSERFTYLAYVGLYYILGQFYSYLFDQYPYVLFFWKKVIITGIVLMVVLLGYLTYQRIGVWKNTLVLFQDAATKTSKIYEANSLLTLAYDFEGAEKSRMKLDTEAIEWFNKAIALSPQNSNLYFNRGVSKFYLNNYRDAIKDFEKAIELDSTNAPAYLNRAIIYLIWNRQEEACANLWKAYRLGMHNAFNLAHANCF